MNTFVFQREEALQNIQPQSGIIHAERCKSRIDGNWRRRVLLGGIPLPVEIERRGGKRHPQHSEYDELGPAFHVVRKYVLNCTFKRSFPALLEARARLSST